MFSVLHERKCDGFWLPLECNKGGKGWSSRIFWIVLQRGLWVCLFSTENMQCLTLSHINMRRVLNATSITQMSVTFIRYCSMFITACWMEAIKRGLYRPSPLLHIFLQLCVIRYCCFRNMKNTRDVDKHVHFNEATALKTRWLKHTLF